MKNERDKNDITKLLFETDGMLTEFDALVLESGKDPETDGSYVVLDRTAFFPEGGGQSADTGMLILKDGSSVAVTDVRTVERQVRHFTDRPVGVQAAVHGVLDEKKRYAMMQEHGAEHLISGLIHNIFGYDNVGFHMSEEGSVIDINGKLTKEELSDIEQRANRIVFENVPVTISFPTPEEAANIDYRSKLDVTGNVRLVTIEGYDVCACCAPHVNSTGQFGVIKIKDSMPHRGGTRITMIAGERAYEDYEKLQADNAAIMKLLSAKRDKTAEYVEDLLDRYGALKEENVTLKKSMTALETEEILERIKNRKAPDSVPEVIFSVQKDPVGLRDLVNECTKAFDGIVCAFMGEEGDYRYIFSVCAGMAGTADLAALTKEFNESCSGRGGGSKVMVQGSCRTKKADIGKFFAGKFQKP